MENFRAYSIKPVLPWDDDTDQDKRYRLLVILFFILGIILSLLFAYLPHTDTPLILKEKIPERIAKVLIRKKEEKKVPLPPVVKKELKLDQEKSKQKDKKIAPPKSEKERRDREAAQQKLNEAKGVLSDLQGIKLDLGSKSLTKGGGQARQSDRKLITSRATSGSGGIQIGSNLSAKDSYGFGGQGKALAGGATTQVESNIGSGSGSGSGNGGLGGAGYKKRALEDIRKVFDTNKGILFSLYSRALRTNPTLQGSILLHLVIAPDGSVTKCEVASNQIADDELVRKIVARVKTFNFGSEDVEIWNNTYEINLVPS